MILGMDDDYCPAQPFRRGAERRSAPNERVARTRNRPARGHPHPYVEAKRRIYGLTHVRTPAEIAHLFPQIRASQSATHYRDSPRIWAYRGRFGFSSFWRIQEPRGRGERRTKFATRNQVQIAASGSLLPLWEKARMRVSPRASAALRAGRPRSHAAKPTPISLVSGGMSTRQAVSVSTAGSIRLPGLLAGMRTHAAGMEHIPYKPRSRR